MNRSSLTLLLLLSATLLVALPRQSSAQSQTGSLVLEVVDADGNSMPDVAITLEGDRLQGIQVRETDEHGRARFAFLPPSTYEAEFEAEGYVTFRRRFAVGLGVAHVESVQMTEGTMTETQIVTGQAGLDLTDSGINYTFSEEKLQNLQIGSANRSYQSALGRAGGVAGGGGNPNVHGATIGENRYLVDGVDTTDPVTGTFGQNLNFDTIEAVEFQTGGFRAESGQATGGIVNVVTKSGSNDFKAIVDMRYRDNGMVDSSDLVLGNGDKAFDNSSPEKFRRIDVTLGGPIKEDKLWYQIGYSDIVSNTQPAGGDAARMYEGTNLLAKLTWQANENHRVALQYTADPADIVNANSGSTVRGDAHRTQEQGADFFSVNYWGQFPNNWNLNMRAGIYESELNSGPAVDSGLPSVINGDNGYLSQNYNDAQFSTRKRDQFAFDLDHQTTSARWHSIKLGLELQDSSFSFERQQPGGATNYVLFGDDEWGANGRIYQRTRLQSAGQNSNEGQVLSMYIQDTWHAMDTLTVDYGLRWDRTTMSDDTGEEIVSFNKFQPRLGIAWDVLGDKRHGLSAHFARYMDPLILTVANAVNKNGDLTIVDRNEEIWGTDYNGDGVLEDTLVEAFSFGGPSGSQTNPDLEATYKDEVTVGYKFAIRSNLSFGARWIWTQTKDIIEDRLDEATGNYVVENVPELTRKYQGLELDVAWEGKRVHLFANWTIAGSKGNVEYTQHLGVDWDFDQVHTLNRYGNLSDDRRHRVKVYGWVDLPKDFQISWDAFFGSGSPYNRLDSVNTPYGSYFIEDRGSRRLPSATNLDFEVRKTWGLGDSQGKITLIASVANALSADSATGVNTNDSYITLDPMQPACDPVTGINCAPNPDSSFEQITAFQGPRNYEFGLRFTW